MKMTYGEVSGVVCNYLSNAEEAWYNSPGGYSKLYGHLVGCVSAVNDYRCRPNGGAEIVGNRYAFYEMTARNDDVEVVLHYVVARWNGDGFPHMINDVWPRPDSWTQVEQWLEDRAEDQKPLHRSRKKVSLNTLVGLMVPEDVPNRPNHIGQLAARIRTLMTESIPPLRIEEHIGVQAVEDAYVDYGTWCPSCMTGEDDRGKTHCWGTNPKQCRLITLHNESSDSKFARVLLFRPLSSLEVAADDAPIGAGWYYGRIYANQNGVGGVNDQRTIAVVRTHLESMGVLDVSLAHDGIVPLKMVEYSPFVDKGYLVMNSGRTQLVWASKGHDNGNETLKRWVALHHRYEYVESVTDGSGFGNHMEEEGDECACCSSRFDAESEGAYVEGYGSVCPGCIEDGDTFVFTVDEEYRHRDEVVELAASKFSTGYRSGLSIHPGSGAYVSSHRRYVHLYPLNGSSMISVQLTTVEIDGDTYKVPSCETVTSLAGDTVWGADASYEEVSKKLVIDDNNRFSIVDVETGIVQEEDVIEFEGENVWIGELPVGSVPELHRDEYRDLCVRHSPDLLSYFMYKYGTAWVATSSGGTVTWSSSPQLAVGDRYRGRGMPMFCKLSIGMQFNVNTTTVNTISIDNVEITYNSDKYDQTTLYDVYGNYNGYAVNTSPWNWAGRMMLESARCCVRNKREPSCDTGIYLCMYDRNGAPHTYQRINRVITCGGTHLMLNYSGDICGIWCSSYSNECRPLHVNDLNNELRSAVEMYNVSHSLLALDSVASLVVGINDLGYSTHPLRSTGAFARTAEGANV